MMCKEELIGLAPVLVLLPLLSGEPLRRRWLSYALPCAAMALAAAWVMHVDQQGRTLYGSAAPALTLKTVRMALYPALDTVGTLLSRSSLHGGWSALAVFAVALEATTWRFRSLRLPACWLLCTTLPIGAALGPAAGQSRYSYLPAVAIAMLLALYWDRAARLHGRQRLPFALLALALLPPSIAPTWAVLVAVAALHCAAADRQADLRVTAAAAFVTLWIAGQLRVSDLPPAAIPLAVGAVVVAAWVVLRRLGRADAFALLAVTMAATSCAPGTAWLLALCVVLPSFPAVTRIPAPLVALLLAAWCGASGAQAWRWGTTGYRNAPVVAAVVSTLRGLPHGATVVADGNPLTHVAGAAVATVDAIARTIAGRPDLTVVVPGYPASADGLDSIPSIMQRPARVDYVLRWPPTSPPPSPAPGSSR
jgi:hypothetical protein